MIRRIEMAVRRHILFRMMLRSRRCGWGDWMTRREFLPFLGGGAAGYRGSAFPRNAAARFEEVRCADEMPALSGA